MYYLYLCFSYSGMFSVQKVQRWHCSCTWVGRFPKCQLHSIKVISLGHALNKDIVIKLISIPRGKKAKHLSYREFVFSSKLDEDFRLSQDKLVQTV